MALFNRKEKLRRQIEGELEEAHQRDISDLEQQVRRAENDAQKWECESEQLKLDYRRLEEQISALAAENRREKRAWPHR